MRPWFALLLLSGVLACGRDAVPTGAADATAPREAGLPPAEPDAETEDAAELTDGSDRPDRTIPDACDVDGVGCASADADADPADAGAMDSQRVDADPIDADPSDVSADAGPAIDLGIDAGPAPGCLLDGDCGRGQWCEPTSLVCVDCWNDRHCLGGRVCDVTGGHVCRNPCIGGVCLSGVCDPDINACVGCLEDRDCGAAEVCDEDTRSCVECVEDADCTLHPGRPFCDPVEASCVACRSDADCGSDQLCDQRVGGCVSVAARALCEPCSNDAQCGGPNDWCLAISGVFDRACARDCRTNPCPSGYDCVSARGNSGRQCRPGYATGLTGGLSGWTPTCRAMRNLGAACAYSANEPDPGCGYDNARDAVCVDVPASGGLCSFACTRPEDCPGATSCTGDANNPGVCL